MVRISFYKVDGTGLGTLAQSYSTKEITGEFRQPVDTTISWEHIKVKVCKNESCSIVQYHSPVALN